MVLASDVKPDDEWRKTSRKPEMIKEEKKKKKKKRNEKRERKKKEMKKETEKRKGGRDKARSRGRNEKMRGERNVALWSEATREHGIQKEMKMAYGTVI